MAIPCGVCGFMPDEHKTEWPAGELSGAIKHPYLNYAALRALHG